jgi:hypothetical protein
MHSFNVIKHHKRCIQIIFYHFFHQIHSTSSTMCEHFEQEVRSVKQLPWKMTSLYVIVHKIVFDMQH